MFLCQHSILRCHSFTISLKLRDPFDNIPAAPSVPDSFLLSDCFFWGGFVIWMCGDSAPYRIVPTHIDIYPFIRDISWMSRFGRWRGWVMGVELCFCEVEVINWDLWYLNTFLKPFPRRRRTFQKAPRWMWPTPPIMYQYLRAHISFNRDTPGVTRVDRPGNL